MGDNTCSKRRGKKDAAVAARTTAKHRARRIAKDAAFKAAKKATAAKRLMLRKRGAVNRLKARLADVSESARPRLLASLAKAEAAVVRLTGAKAAA